MSKRLAAEIEKCLREAQANMQTYDVKWRELKSYNEATANPDWATLGNGVIKFAAPEPLQLSGLKPKKAHSSNAIITVDISHMDEKQVNEAKDKLKNELEALMKKVYRSRQQILEWLSHADLTKQQCGNAFTREHLVDAKKEIESRHRRGKVYYLRGVSSEDTTNEQADQFRSGLAWMQDYIEQLRHFSDQLTAEIETLNRNKSQTAPLATTPLNAAVEMYLLHANKLDEFLRGLRNNTISVRDSGDDQDATMETEEGTTMLLERLTELKELLTPLIESNEDLTYIVGEDIYSELGIIVSGSSTAKENDSEDWLASGTKSNEPLVGEESRTSAKGSTRTTTGGISYEEKSPQTVSYRAAASSKPSPSSPSKSKSSSPRMSSSPIKAAAATVTKAASPKISSSSPRQSLTSAKGGCEQDNVRALMEARVKQLQRQLCSPQWSGIVGLELCTGVTSDICDINLLWQLAPAVREQVLHQVECMVTSQANSLPVLVMDDDVVTLPAKRSWYGDVGGGPETLQKVLNESALLYVDEGNMIEILAIAPKERWTYGRLRDDKSRQGWLPSFICGDPPPNNNNYLHHHHQQQQLPS